MLVFPGIVHNVGMELKEKLVHSIRGQNGSLVAYWTAVYIFHYSVYGAFTTAFVIFQYLIGTEPILNCNFGQLFAILIVWGHAQIGFGIFLSMVLRKTRLEVLSAYIIMLILWLQCQLLECPNHQMAIFFMAFPSHCFCAFFVFSNGGCCTTAHNCDGNLKHVMDKHGARLDWHIYTLSKFI